MENFYDTQVQTLEAKASPTLTNRFKPNMTPGQATTTKHNKSGTSEYLYYVKSVLGSGRVQVYSESKETPTLPFLPSSPNERLITQLSNFLKAQNIDHILESIAGVKSVVIRTRDGINLTTLLIQSKPYNGISYVHLTKLSTDNFGMQISASFVAHTPEMICAKLLRQNALLCPKSFACLTVCPDCPEL